LQGSDFSFGCKLREKLGEKERFGFSARLPSIHFDVEHFAGKVHYNCKGILDKNRDNLSSSMH
jgi:myosin heavy subunit